jgi:3-deoxy-D-arabino-heptulosonate 7-phosphate (DAHP) synthase
MIPLEFFTQTIMEEVTSQFYKDIFGKNILNCKVIFRAFHDFLFSGVLFCLPFKATTDEAVAVIAAAFKTQFFHKKTGYSVTRQNIAQNNPHFLLKKSN